MRAQPALREDLAKVIEQSGFKLVEGLEKSRRLTEAADAYLAFARDWPQSRLAPTALYDASVALGKSGRLDRAMAVREQLVAALPAGPARAQGRARERAGPRGGRRLRPRRRGLRAILPGVEAGRRRHRRARAEAGEAPRATRAEGRRRWVPRGEGEGRALQRGSPARGARPVRTRRGEPPPVRGDLAHLSRCTTRLPLARGPRRAPGRRLEGAAAPGGVPAEIREGPHRVADGAGPHRAPVPEDGQRRRRAPRLRAGPPLLEPAPRAGGRARDGGGGAGAVPRARAGLRGLRADRLRGAGPALAAAPGEVAQGAAPVQELPAARAAEEVHGGGRDEAGRAGGVRALQDRARLPALRRCAPPRAHPEGDPAREGARRGIPVAARAAGGGSREEGLRGARVRPGQVERAVRLERLLQGDGRDPDQDEGRRVRPAAGTGAVARRPGARGAAARRPRSPRCALHPAATATGVRVGRPAATREARAARSRELTARFDLPLDEPEAVHPSGPPRGAQVPPPIKEEDLLP